MTLLVLTVREPDDDANLAHELGDWRLLAYIVARGVAAVSSAATRCGCPS